MWTKDFNDGWGNMKDFASDFKRNKPEFKRENELFIPNFSFYWIQINRFKLVTLSGVRAESLITGENKIKV